MCLLSYFHCQISEAVIRGMAQAMVSSGLDKHGYRYINIDDCWADHRDSANRTIPDAAQFPSGIYALASSIHALGLKFGIYSDSGTKTCAGRPGSLGYEVIDALTYAAWGVDYLKYDDCNANGLPEGPRYWAMHDALNATGKPILFSVCAGFSHSSTWAPALGNSWRTTDDINVGWPSIMSNLLQNNAYWQVAAPGQWNDPDMLEVGNGLTHDEAVSHFSLWCLVKSPLILGNDLRNMSADTLAILTNDEVIAINQDPLGVQGHQVANSSAFDVWAGPLSDGSIAVVLFNRNDSATAASITARWTDIGLPEGAKATVRDLWTHQDVGSFTGSFSVKGLVPRASATVRITPSDPAVRAAVVRNAVRTRNDGRAMRTRAQRLKQRE